jgi:hypothetical protein
MAKIPDYLIEYNSVDEDFKETIEDVIEHVNKTVENMAQVEEYGISGIFVGIIGALGGMFFFSIVCVLIFFIKKKPHREVQKRSIYRGK